MKFTTQERKTIFRWMRNSFFPREYSLKRYLVYTEEELEDDGDMYISIFSNDELTRDIYDTIAFDIDGHENLNDAFESYNIVRKKLWSNRLTISRAYFSGRGFWIFIDLKTPIETSFRYKEMCKFIVDKLGIKPLIDQSVIGDVRRMARVPATYNSKGERYMVEIDPEHNYTFDEITKRSKQNLNWIPNRIPSRVDAVKIIYDLGFSETEFKKIMEKTSKISFNTTEYPPCIKTGINNLVATGELNHRERIHLCSFLLANGQENDAYRIFSVAGDYNPTITDYQIKYIKSGNGYLYNCENVSNEICPYANKHKCIFYPNISYALRSRKLESN